MQDRSSITCRKSAERRALYNQTCTHFANCTLCDTYFIVVTSVEREQDSEDTGMVTVCVWLC